MNATEAVRLVESNVGLGQGVDHHGYESHGVERV